MILVHPTDAAERFWEKVAEIDEHDVVIFVGEHEHVVTGGVMQTLRDAARMSGVATASPVPAGAAEVSLYSAHPDLPPPPSLALPCRSLCAINVGVIAALGRRPTNVETVADLVLELSERALQQGWRHVAAPGVALRWDPADSSGIRPTAAWSKRTISNMTGPANRGLETHTTWAESRLRPLTVLIDGACLSGDLHTGTQHLVIEITTWLAITRPGAHLILAAPGDQLRAVRAHLSSTAVEVIDRDHTDDVDVDVVYRPYQMLNVNEYELVRTVGRRRLIGQLDMIGFANPFYHPSPNLFAIARNLQRTLMRTSDAVTFISSYGLEAAVAECPDLERDRLHVVSCGADPRPVAPAKPSRHLDGPFLLCLSATFWHKNRQQAIATFDELVRTSDYDGSLVIVGPEPFYGRSTGDDDELVARLPAGVRSRIMRYGRASDAEKWWLLEHADAVIYPSTIEGFGLVPFEAAAVGTPCVSYAGTAQAELLGDTESTVSTWLAKDWADRIAEWVDVDGAADRVIGDVKAVASHHTWERCASLTWDAIDDTLARPQRMPLDDQDGGRLATVSEPQGRRGRLKFTVARAQPAIQRRVRHASKSLRRSSK